MKEDRGAVFMSNLWMLQRQSKRAKGKIAEDWGGCCALIWLLRLITLRLSLTYAVLMESYL
jgi:hypothetical protein